MATETAGSPINENSPKLQIICFGFEQSEVDEFVRAHLDELIKTTGAKSTTIVYVANATITCSVPRNLAHTKLDIDQSVDYVIVIGKLAAHFSKRHISVISHGKGPILF